MHDVYFFEVIDPANEGIEFCTVRRAITETGNQKLWRIP